MDEPIKKWHLVPADCAVDDSSEADRVKEGAESEGNNNRHCEFILHVITVLRQIQQERHNEAHGVSSQETGYVDREFKIVTEKNCDTVT